MADAKLEAVLKIQKEYFTKCFKYDTVAPIVGVQDPKQFGNLHPRCNYSWDTNVQNKQAFIRDVNGHLEYWVHVDNLDYREDFLKFLDLNYSLPRSVVPKVLHVDHLLHKAFAKKYGINYVQLALVWQEYNVGFGFGIERNFSAREDIKGKNMYLMDYSLMFKVLGIKPFQTKDEFEKRKIEIAGKFVSEGAVENIECAIVGLEGFFKLWDVIK